MASSIWASIRAVNGTIFTPTLGASALDCLLDPGLSARSRGTYDRHLRQIGCDLLEQFEPFCAHAGFDIGDSGDVATGMLQALDEALAGRIDHVDEHNRDGFRGLLHRFEHGGAVHHQDVGREPDQFHRGVLKIGIVRQPIVDSDVVAVCPA